MSQQNSGQLQKTTHYTEVTVTEDGKRIRRRKRRREQKQNIKPDCDATSLPAAR
ncbi:hypothetical protein ALO_02221 [Acetonema longum DSM 6540]|uniref:Uncharacterized protein n=1 Tax=Acetonema longum DSM 6540 TaxID=1009370 RepID=F7NEI1_9FIRM|nr:hypothetical protein ALO_02221 [Acetonema longum DSM 6540]